MATTQWNRIDDAEKFLRNAEKVGFKEDDIAGAAFLERRTESDAHPYEETWILLRAVTKMPMRAIDFGGPGGRVKPDGL